MCDILYSFLVSSFFHTASKYFLYLTFFFYICSTCIFSVLFFYSTPSTIFPSMFFFFLVWLSRHIGLHFIGHLSKLLILYICSFFPFYFFVMYSCQFLALFLYFLQKLFFFSVFVNIHAFIFCLFFSQSQVNFFSVHLSLLPDLM